MKWGEATTDEMCIGFIAVTKKGQDLTRPGEKDDLMEIFHKQREEYRARREQAIREAREKDARSRAPLAPASNGPTAKRDGASRRSPSDCSDVSPGIRKGPGPSLLRIVAISWSISALASVTRSS